MHPKWKQAHILAALVLLGNFDQQQFGLANLHGQSFMQKQANPSRNRTRVRAGHMFKIQFALHLANAMQKY